MRPTPTRGSGQAPPAWDSPPQHRAGQAALVGSAALVLVPALVLTGMRVFPPVADAPALLASFIPYALVGYLVALVCLVVAAVRARRRTALGVAALLVLGPVAAHLAWLGPVFVPDGRPVTTPTFTVLSVNIYKGLAEPEALVARAAGADVVVLVETTPAALRALDGSGWDERFPYAVGVVGDDVSDTAVFSRFPILSASLTGPPSFQQWLTTLDVTGIGPVRLVAAHPCNPYCGSSRWAFEHAALRTLVLPHLDEALVVAGDFNAVDDHGPLQTLRSDGLRSATDLTGAGWLPTFPAGRALPPLIPIDHVLVSRRLTATSVERVEVPGTDHLGLLTTLAGTS